MQSDFERIAIINRGEAAMRFIHAAREFNHENGTSLRTIALYTDPDRHAMFVCEADEAVPLGPARVFDEATHHSHCAYVDYPVLTRALLSGRADAVWVGWGFIAEHADFADLCRSMGLVFIGPDGAVMRKLGDKISSKLLAEQAQIPVAPWSGGPVETLAEAETHAARLGYPLLVKATAGGGGHGIRRVNSACQLAEAFESARADALRSFGNPSLFLEQLVEEARHVEVQILADRYGTTWAVGVRDCTIQRRHQKVLEEAPSPALTPLQDQALREAAVRLSTAAGYCSAGTVEFLYQPATHLFSFMEMNTRLQVEHPVTERTTGIDLVKLQIHIARGGRLEGSPPQTTGHAIEVRLNAEDPENGFAPAPGTIERFRIATGPGVRIDTGVAVGDTIPVEFDSMIAKIIAFGQNRKEALSRLQRVLRESVVVIKGGASNKAFLLELLSRAEVQEATGDIGWLDRLSLNGGHCSRNHADVALVQAGIEAYVAELAVEKAQFYASAARGRPQGQSGVSRGVELRFRGQRYSLKVSCLAHQQYRVEVDGSVIDARVHPLGPFEYWLTVFGRRYHVVSIFQGASYRIEVDGVSHSISRDDGGVVHAPGPSVVVSIAVKPGDLVSAGDTLVVLEAMKLELAVAAPFSGRVRQVMIIPHVQVDAGSPLLQVEATEENEPAKPSERVAFGAAMPAGQPAQDKQSAGWRSKLHELRQFMLGFDVDTAQATRLLGEWSRFSEEPADRDEVREREDEVLDIFVDICSLFRHQPSVHDRTGGEAPSTESYLFAYLRRLETRGEGLPPDFLKAVQRTLTHYGVQSLEPTAALEESLLWIHKSHQRVERQCAIILSLLERRMAGLESLGPQAPESFRPLLQRLIGITRGSFPAVSDLAREVYYRCFEQPVFEQARSQVYAEVEKQLAYLDANPNALDRQEKIQALIDCPQPLASLFSGRIAAAASSLRELMLEVVTARYYRGQTLRNIHTVPLDGHSCVAAEYQQNGACVHVFATHCEFHRFPEALKEISSPLASVPAQDEVELDVYLWNPTFLSDSELTQQELEGALKQAKFPRSVRRILVAVAGPNRGRGMASMQHFTYRLSANGYAEEKLLRGIHPMMAERLHLWRLQGFNLERQPSVEDVYLLHAVAHENPKDERLFAVAEVRDLTAVRDEQGALVQLPHLERMFAEAVAAMRHFQSRRLPHERLYWNRILLYIWPPLLLKTEEISELAHRLAPSADSLGLEQVVVLARTPDRQTGELRDAIVRISSPGDAGLLISIRPATQLQPLKPLTEYNQKVVRMRRRGLIYPYEIVKMITPALDNTRAEFPTGEFIEHDLDPAGHLVAVERPHGQNKSNIIVGVIRNFTAKYPEGMTRVLLLGDPSRDMGALAEPECRRIIEALNLAEQMRVPLEWFPVSAGAKISMDSGVENMDWISAVLRRLIEFTQGGGEVNLIVNGINVGAQPYWNAEATMLMHTRGILVMTPKAAMVLTGKRALDYSGSVSADDNEGIGGYDRIMGPNGQAQYWARDIDEGCQILFRHYDHTYIEPGERFPRRAVTNDPVDRDVRVYPHGGADGGFELVGEIFSAEANAGRKRPFDIRKVMMAVSDQDQHPLERWPSMRGAETAVIWDAHLGGYPVCLIGIESHSVSRLGFAPADGPEQWNAGTLFPRSSKKVARAINAASNNRPVVILANLSGFDGSPESMRKLQLEYGAEIGRAVVNFKGPMVFCGISRYHGGAYVVFSQVLNEQLEVVALEGTYASVIGGAPAAAVVFSSEVEARTRKDPRLEVLTQAMAKADNKEKSRLRAQWNELFKVVHSQKLGEMAEEFDSVHSVHRALKVGALSKILPAANLRPYLIDAVARGIQKTEALLSPSRPSALPKSNADSEAETLLARPVGQP